MLTAYVADDHCRVCENPNAILVQRESHGAKVAVGAHAVDLTGAGYIGEAQITALCRGARVHVAGIAEPYRKRCDVVADIYTGHT